MKPGFLLTLISAIAAIQCYSQQRYLDEVFNQVKVTQNVVYGQNFSVLKGYPLLQDLNADLYEPDGDTAALRPLIIFIHTGSFLPLLINQTPAGDMRDSATVEMCNRFARRGYVVASIDYRLGWNPYGGTQDIRTGTILQAVYRAVQDARTCVRYFKMDASVQGNVFHIDTGRIALCGQGSGGYIALAYASLDKESETQLEKFIATTNDVTYGFVAGQPYVNFDIMGDIDGLGGLPILNHDNWPGYSNAIDMVINLGGAMGDSSWLEAGDVPIISFHPVNDPYAPYGASPCFCDCPVYVPTTGQFVVNVSGSLCVERRTDDVYNNNQVLHYYSDGATDPFTARANAINEGHEGLFPFILPDPGPPFYGQVGPWEWWDVTALEAIAPFYGLTTADADAASFGALLTNPDMSKDKAMHYIDTILGYSAPRLVQALQLPGNVTGIEEQENIIESVQVAPNPASEWLTVSIQNSHIQVKGLKLYDAIGRLVMNISNINGQSHTLNCSGLHSGIYFLKIKLSEEELIRKIEIE